MPSVSYNSIHRQQLFHWIGYHIEERAIGGKLTNDLREEYVDCLDDALKKRPAGQRASRSGSIGRWQISESESSHHLLYRMVFGSESAARKAVWPFGIGIPENVRLQTRRATGDIRAGFSKA